jgi:hypothetical protein
MKKLVALSCCLLATLIVGCGQKSAPPPPKLNANAFENASPELKQMWEQATTSAANNQFGPAIVTLRDLSRQPLSPQQMDATHDAVVIYANQLRERVKAGDADAKKALEDLGMSLSPPKP